MKNKRQELKFSVKEKYFGKVIMQKDGIFVLDDKLPQEILKRLYERHKDKIGIY